ncbi:MAG: tryptophan synthase subunit alpha [Rhodospirillaceae bacterium]|nr:tryptophan synthase subunit alpha [Rhodospirillaceae bacterium]|tara:strand:- start:6112 stop:6939 length:828 start_codon:yes stop_codon:yes gene_type:complete
MNSRIFETFLKLKKNNRKGFIPFITAGDPTIGMSLDIIKSLPKVGADLIEIGMPFSDPMADGKIIQASSLRALKEGITIEKILEMISKFRQENATTPIVLMGYFNPIYNFGIDKFLSYCKESGVDGLIIVDLPYEHDSELCIPARKSGLDFIRLIAPTTTDERMPLLLNQSSGFVYCISLSGITGSKEAQIKVVNDTIHRIRKSSDLPIAVGFGIKTPQQASEMLLSADATVIGSIIVEKINEIYSSDKEDNKKLKLINDFINTFSNEIHKQVRN